MEEGIGGIKIQGVERDPLDEGEVTDPADAIAKCMFQISVHTSKLLYIMNEQTKIMAQDSVTNSQGMQAITQALYELLGNEKIGKVLDSIASREDRDPFGVGEPL
tara:strand:+ start:13880 stop:14194 length:315 start_codon:yes stop_codon:yes gene_type:complete